MNEIFARILPAGTVVKDSEYRLGVQEMASGEDADIVLARNISNLIAYDMETKRDQVQDRQQVGQLVGAMSKVDVMDCPTRAELGHLIPRYLCI